MTLVLACVFAAGWVRSYIISDRIVIEDAHFIIASVFGRIQWGVYGFEVPDTPIEWQTQAVRTISPEYETPDYRNYNQEIPYWKIVLPLTLLANWLLLSNPRPEIPSERPVDAQSNHRPAGSG